MTARRVVYSRTVTAKIQLDLKYLDETDRKEWAQLLEEDLRVIEGLLAAAPRAGTCMETRGRRELRKMRLRRTPFVIWYVCEPTRAAAPVILLELFHVRQRSRRPRGW